MNKIIIVLIIALASVNTMSLMEKYPMNFSSKRSIMTLLTQVESQLKAGGPLDAITHMLNEFIVTITEEQVNHDNLWADQQVECASEFEFRENEVANAQAAFDEATETLDGCSSQLVRAEGDLSITKKQLIENRSFLAQVEDSRRRQSYEFETQSTALGMSMRACEEALVILEEVWAGESSFAQLTGHMNGLVKSSIKVKKAHLMNGLMSALVQLSNKEIQADEEVLNRVKTLIENFKTKLEQGLQWIVAVEEDAIKTYTEEKARLESTIESLIAQQSGLEAEIQELTKCVVVQQSIISSASTKLSRNGRLLHDAHELCEAVEEEYHVATEARSEEVELLHQIQARVEVRFGEISEGVTERGKQDEFEYEANYDYEEAEFVPSTEQ